MLGLEVWQDHQALLAIDLADVVPCVNKGQRCQESLALFLALQGQLWLNVGNREHRAKTKDKKKQQWKTSKNKVRTKENILCQVKHSIISTYTELSWNPTASKYACAQFVRAIPQMATAYPTVKERTTICLRNISHNDVLASSFECLFFLEAQGTPLPPQLRHITLDLKDPALMGT